MASKVKRTQILFDKGAFYETDPRQIPEGYCAELFNMQVYHNVLRKAWGMAPNVASFTGPANNGNLVKIVDTFHGSSSTKFAILITDRDFFWGNGSSTWSSAAWATGVDWMDTCIFKGLYIAVCASGLKKFNGSALSDLGGISSLSLTGAVACASCGGHLILGGTVESAVWYGDRVRWSQIGTCDTWIGSDTSAGYITTTSAPGFVVAIRQMTNDKCLVYKSKSIIEIQYVGGDKVFEQYVVPFNLGILHPRNVCIVPEEGMVFSHYFIANATGQIFRMSPQGQLEEVGQPLKKKLRGPSAGATGDLADVHIGYDPFTHELVITKEPSLQGTGYPECYIMDLKSRVWHQKVLNPPFEAGHIPEIGPTFWDSAYQTEVLGFATPVGSHPAHYALYKRNYWSVTNHSGSDAWPTGGDANIESWFTTKVYEAEAGARLLRVTAELMSPSGGVELLVSVNEGKTWTSIGVRYGDAVSFVPVDWTMDITGESLQLKFVFGKDSEARLQNIFMYTAPRAGMMGTVRVSVVKNTVESFLSLTDFTNSWQPIDNYGELSFDPTGGSYGRPVILFGNNADNDSARYYHRTSIPYDPYRLYRVRVRVQRILGSLFFYAGVAGRNAADNDWVAYDGSNTYHMCHYIACDYSTTLYTGLTEYVGYFKGTATTGENGPHPTMTDPAKLHTNVKFVRPVIVTNWVGAGKMGIDMFIIDIVG